MRFAERMNYLKASEIREILKLTEEPDIISFAGGLPAPEMFPIEKLRDIAYKVLDKDGHGALQYGMTEDYKPLRKIIAEQRMKTAGVSGDFNNVLITNGSLFKNLLPWVSIRLGICRGSNYIKICNC